MGYEFDKIHDLSFHHLIIPRRECEIKRIPSQGYVYWNGAILVQDTSHNYLHTIERYDRERFEAITSEMIDINMQGKIQYENLQNIEDVLESFENEYSGYTTKSGEEIVKEKYVRRRKFK